MKSFLLAIFVFISIQISAQSTIKGTVKDAKTGETLIGCNVYIQGTTNGTATDLDGNFTIKNAPTGSYNLVASYISYNQKIERVTVSKNAVSEIIFDLEPASVAINEVRVTATKRNDTEMSMISAIKASSLVTSGIASQQIAKSQDRDASEVIRRVPGITIIEDRFVIVRGLSERYNSVMLNNAPAPSSETDVRAFSFDVIPSSMIDRLQIYKTPAPELPGDFAGGAIKIFTKNIPESDGITIGYSGSFLQNTTTKPFVEGNHGKYDFLGYDDGSRKLPEGTPSNINTLKDKTQIDNLSKKFDRNWKTDTTNAPIDNRFSVVLSKRINLGQTTLGNITSINYSNTFSYRNLIRSSNSSEYDPKTMLRNVEWRYNNNQYINTAKVGVMHNWSWAFGKNNKLEFRNFYNHSGYTRTTNMNGSNFADGTTKKGIQHSFFERGTYSGQLGGEHQFNDNNDKLDWIIGYSNASRNEPNVKRFQWLLNSSDSEDPYNNKYWAYIPNYPDAGAAGILYMKTNETIKNFGTNYEHKFIVGETFNPILKTGFYAETKSRSFDARLLGFTSSPLYPYTRGFAPIDTIFADHNINSTNGIYIAESTNPSDSYTASNDLLAGYIAFNIPVTKRISIYTGVRVENNVMKLNSFSSDFNKIPVNAKITGLNWFPSANLTLNITEKSLFRLAYGKTINRPEFRELAPFSYYDFEMSSSLRGNDSLKNATIHNFDFRYEFYPEQSEIFTIGLFYKKFIDPIETIIIPSGSGLNYSYKNAESASSLGAEMEIRKSFAALESNPYLFFLKNFTVILNGSLIKSEVLFNKKDLAIKSSRPMQGQSPYVANAGLYYQTEKYGLQMAVLYNVIGKRIVYVSDGDSPDLYELPRNLLDFTFTKTVGKYVKIKGGIQDILNEPYENTQFFESKEATNGNIAESKSTQNTLYYTKGPYYTLGIVLTF